MADESARAFPIAVSDWQYDSTGPDACGGMTLREWYAGAALRSVLDHSYRTGRLSLAECASEAVLAADALLAALRES